MGDNSLRNSSVCQVQGPSTCSQQHAQWSLPRCIWRKLGRTNAHRIWAARLEPTAGWRIDEAGRFATVIAVLEPGFEMVGIRGGGDEQLGVGMRRALGHSLAVPAFYDPAGVHHQGGSGEVSRGGDVVRDVEDREPQPFLAGRAAG